MERSEELFKRICSIGESAIDEFISSRESEHLFLDFKRSSDHGRGVRLSNDDRNNFAKAISGFGNSEGGSSFGVWIAQRERTERPLRG